MLADNLLLWAHLCAMAAYFGAQFAVIYMLLPAAERAGDESVRRAALITGFRFYNPFVLGALGVVLMTGAMMVTDLKAGMLTDYYARIGRPLAFKLLLAFLVIFLQTYITFGLAFRIGRQEEVAAHGDGEPFTKKQVDSMLRRIRYVTWFTILLTAAIILVSLRISERASESATAFSLVAPLMPLDECYQRADGVEERDNREHRTGHLAQQHILREPDTLGRGLGIGIRRYRHDSRIVRRRVHCHFLHLVSFSSDGP
jgi:uncharacterized membrane protein